MGDSFYSLEDIHYNSRGVIQVAQEENFESMQEALEIVDQEIKRGSNLERGMLSFFRLMVDPVVAYRDNDLNQLPSGPRRMHVVGKLKDFKEEGPYLRIGVNAPGENSLIPTLQAFYLKEKVRDAYMAGQVAGQVTETDRWAYNFTERYGGMVEAKVSTRKGVSSLVLISMINEGILDGSFGPQDLSTFLSQSNPSQLSSG